MPTDEVNILPTKGSRGMATAGSQAHIKRMHVPRLSAMNAYKLGG